MWTTLCFLETVSSPYDVAVGMYHLPWKCVELIKHSAVHDEIVLDIPMYLYKWNTTACLPLNAILASHQVMSVQQLRWMSKA